MVVHVGGRGPRHKTRTQSGAWGTQVATRSFVPSSGGYNSGSTTISTTSVHTTRDAVTALRLVDLNWYVSSVNGQELGPGASTTHEWVIEYPASTFTRILFGGANLGTIPDGGTVESDVLAIAIPDNTAFKLHCRQICSGGILYWDKASSAFGDRLSFGAQNPITGGIPDDLSNFTFSPAAIIAKTAQRSAVFFGTSRSYGINDTADATGDIGIIGRGAGPQIAYCNAGIPSDKASTFLSTGAKRLALLKYFTDVVIELGVNDSVGTRAADVQTLYNLVSGKRVHGVTMSPVTSGAWTVGNGSDQTVSQDVNAFNNAVPRALPAPLYSVFECADPVMISRASNKWLAPGYTTDGIHESNTAALAVRNIGAVDFGMKRPSGQILTANLGNLIGFTANRGTLTTGVATPPDGTSTGATFVEDATNNTHYAEIFFAHTVTAVPYEWSVLVKPLGPTARYFVLTVYDGSFGSTASVGFNLATGVIVVAATSGGSFSAPSGRIVAVGEGWYRCTLRWTGAALSNLDLIAQAITTAGAGTYTGDGASGFYLAQADLRRP